MKISAACNSVETCWITMPVPKLRQGSPCGCDSHVAFSASSPSVQREWWLDYLHAARVQRGDQASAPKDLGREGPPGERYSTSAVGLGTDVWHLLNQANGKCEADPWAPRIHQGWTLRPFPRKVGIGVHSKMKILRLITDDGSNQPIVRGRVCIRNEPSQFAITEPLLHCGS